MTKLPSKGLTAPKIGKSITDAIDLNAEQQPWPKDFAFNDENLGKIPETHYVTFESSYNPLMDADEFDWYAPGATGKSKNKSAYRGRYKQDSAFYVSRDLTTWNPYCRRAIDLYEMYLFGTGYYMSISPKDIIDSLESLKLHYEMMLKAEAVWSNFLAANLGAFSLVEMVRRAERDGEVFIALDKESWPWKARFIDREEIGEPNDARYQDTQGIVTLEDDENTVIEYVRITRDTKEIVDIIPADDMIHIALDKDSNQKRGNPRLLSALMISRLLEEFSLNETTHRQIQSSIVIRRKVAGGGQIAQNVLLNSRTGQNSSGTSYERFGRGTILTEPKGVETEFVQPRSDFSDASPLARFLLQHISATTGWSYAKLSQDTSQGNLNSQALAEGPEKQMINRERDTFLPHLQKLLMGLLTEAARRNEMGPKYRGGSLWDDYDPYFNFGTDQERDPLKMSQSQNMQYMMNSISAQDICESNGRNWIKTLMRILAERGLGVVPASFQMPTNADRANSSTDNATKGGGTNQDASEPN